MLQTWQCEVCGKKFSVGQWICADGNSPHVVPTKMYRSLDAPTDPGHPASGSMDSLRDGRTRVCNMPPDEYVMVAGERHVKPGGYVEFIRGRFSTSNPQIQYLLDQRPDYNATEEQWEHVWLSDNQQLQLERMRLDAMKQRLENERNDLLAQQKAVRA